jgi:hypothetical protein
MPEPAWAEEAARTSTLASEEQGRAANNGFNEGTTPPAGESIMYSQAVIMTCSTTSHSPCC